MGILFESHFVTCMGTRVLKIDSSLAGLDPYASSTRGDSSSVSDRLMPEINVLFNDTLNIVYLRLYGVRHMVNYHSDSERERGNTLPPHGLLLPISSKGSLICIIPQSG